MPPPTCSTSLQEPEFVVFDELAERGSFVWKEYCGICHGPGGKMGYNNATDLSTSVLSRDEVVARILEGKSTMPPFRDLLTADQVQLLTDYTLQLRKGTP